MPDLHLSELTDEHFEIARKAIEDELIDWRERRLSLLGRGNGLVVKEADGTESSTIRMGPETAVRIGLRAILESDDGG